MLTQITFSYLKKFVVAHYLIGKSGLVGLGVVIEMGRCLVQTPLGTRSAKGSNLVTRLLVTFGSKLDIHNDFLRVSDAATPIMVKGCSQMADKKNLNISVSFLYPNFSFPVALTLPYLRLLLEIFSFSNFSHFNLERLTWRTIYFCFYIVI